MNQQMTLVDRRGRAAEVKQLHLTPNEQRLFGHMIADFLSGHIESLDQLRGNITLARQSWANGQGPQLKLSPIERARQTLGVDHNSTQNEIQMAYRRLAAQYHPDRGGSHEKMLEINKAYQVLKG